MEKQVLATIKEYDMLKPCAGVVVGLSGGADSVALVHFLCGLSLGLRIVCVHINHGLRGREADGDAEFCADFCNWLGLDLVVFKLNVAAEAKKMGIGIEAAGRKLRYDCLYKVLHQKDHDKIAVAHNKNDVAETVIMHIMRGAGSAKGIAAANGSVIRPFIDVDKDEILAYCERHGLDYRKDSTNNENDYSRNWIRNFLVPHIEGRLNPSVTEALCRLSKISADEDVFLDISAKTAYRKCVSSNEINIQTLNQHETAIQRRIVRLVLERIFGDMSDITYDHVGSVLDLALKQSGKMVHLPRGFLAERVYDAICIKKSETADGFSVTLSKNNQLFVPQINCWIYLGASPPQEKAFTKALNCDKISNVQIRTRQPGDRIFFKSVGTKKIKDFFSDKKIPRAQREKAVFIVCGQDIIIIVDEAKMIESDKFSPAPGDETIYLQIWRD